MNRVGCDDRGHGRLTRSGCACQSITPGLAAVLGEHLGWLPVRLAGQGGLPGAIALDDGLLAVVVLEGQASHETGDIPLVLALGAQFMTARLQLAGQVDLGGLAPIRVRDDQFTIQKHLRTIIAGN